MYKCGKNVTCNFGEVSFDERILYRGRILKESPDEKCTVNDVFTLYVYTRSVISCWCTPFTKIKTGAEESFIKVERWREIQFCDMCTTNFRVARWFEFVSVYYLSRYPDVNYRLNVSSQIFICEHLTRSLDSYLFLYIGATSFLLKQNIWFKYAS